MNLVEFLKERVKEFGSKVFLWEKKNSLTYKEFDEATDRRVEEFTESVSFDRRLYAHDIEGSIAHAQMLTKVGIPHTFTFSEGGHTWNNWRLYLSEIAPMLFQ